MIVSFGLLRKVAYVTAELEQILLLGTFTLLDGRESQERPR